VSSGYLRGVGTGSKLARSLCDVVAGLGWLTLGLVSSPRRLAFLAASSVLLTAQAPLSDGGAVARPSPKSQEPLLVVQIDPEEAIVEGRPLEIGCLFIGPAAKSWAVIAEAELTPLGGKKRGAFATIVAGARPVDCTLACLGLSAATFHWTPEWFDSRAIALKVKFFARDGSLAGVARREFDFVPACAQGMERDCVVISKEHQRLYALVGGHIAAVYLVSTGTRHRDGGGPTPAMMTHIVRKTPYAWSRKYESPMHYWNAISGDGAYGIHATVPGNYRALGRPASHGCIRLHRDDAEEFYRLFPVGTPVVVSNL
jgi:hypothetical protein